MEDCKTWVGHSGGIDLNPVQAPFFTQGLQSLGSCRTMNSNPLTLVLPTRLSADLPIEESAKLINLIDLNNFQSFQCQFCLSLGSAVLTRGIAMATPSSGMDASRRKVPMHVFCCGFPRCVCHLSCFSSYHNWRCPFQHVLLLLLHMTCIPHRRKS